MIAFFTMQSPSMAINIDIIENILKIIVPFFDSTYFFTIKDNGLIKTVKPEPGSTAATASVGPIFSK